MYYNTEDQKWFATRSEAFLYPKPCYFYFFDKEFLQVNWKAEPTKTLAELYQERAEQLRNRYDYLILAYSGGVDSTNVLESFYYNQLPLDEIALVGSFSQDSFSGSNDNNNAEIHLTAWPTLRKLGMDKTVKITVIDYTKYFDNPNNISLFQNYGSDWINYGGSWYSFHHIFWRDIKNYLQIPANKRAAIIFGMEKPEFYWDGSRGYTQFYDLLDEYGTRCEAMDEDPQFHRVYFYTSPDTTELMRKQLHTISNWFHEHVIRNETVSLALWQQKRYAIVERLVYNLHNPLLFKTKKSPHTIFSIRDSFMAKKKDTAIYKLWAEGIKKLPRQFIKNALDNRAYSIPTRKYYIT